MAQQKSVVSIPASGGEAGLNRYLSEIKKFPILSPEEEYMLAKSWREHGDTEAAAKLVNSTFASSPRSRWVTAATACRSAISSPKAMSG